jgi:hypothetical protein
MMAAHLVDQFRYGAICIRRLFDALTHTPRRSTPSPEFPGLAGELAAGAPLVHRLFPILWRA